MTATVSLIARLMLAVVLAVAGWAKLSDRAGAREAVVAFGVPAAIAGPVALLIPLAEVLAALLLLPAVTAIAGAIVALALLLAFSVAITVNLAHGRAPDCHCFGQLHSAPAGAKTLARNGVLAAAAVFVVAGASGPSAVAWIGRLHAAGLGAFVAGIVCVALTAAFAIGFTTLLRSYGRVLLRVDRLEQALAAAGIEVALDAPAELAVIPPRRGLVPGTPAPAFALTGVDGAAVSLTDLLAPRRPLMLVFASARCGPCSALMPQLGEWQREHADRLTVAIASAGPAADIRAEAQELALEHVLLDEDAAVLEAFEATGTPSAVLIAGDGAIASYVASGRDAIEALLHEVLDAPGIPIGAPAPSLTLETLSGETVELPGRSDLDRLLLFWNPDCGFCRTMHEDLLDWEASVNGDGPRLIVVSSGERERSREDGFRSTVVLDPGFTVGEAFGAGGTPSAVMLGPDGCVASGVAVGAQAVLGLTRRRAAMAEVGA